MYPNASSSRIELLMNLPNLLIDIHPLPPLHLLALLQLAIVIQRRLLPPRGLLFADDGLSGDTVENIAALRCKPLEIGCNVAGREIGRRLPKLGLESLFFPAGVEEFNCDLNESVHVFLPDELLSLG